MTTHITDKPKVGELMRVVRCAICFETGVRHGVGGFIPVLKSVPVNMWGYVMPLPGGLPQMISQEVYVCEQHFRELEEMTKEIL